MPTFTADFLAASKRVHSEHQELLRELDALETALNQLAGSSHGSGAIDEVCGSARHLAESLRENMDQEEITIFPVAKEISPELSDFTREMRRQHDQLRARLAGFSRAVESLALRQELDETIWKVREGGVFLIQELADHVNLEQRLLDGLI